MDFCCGHFAVDGGDDLEARDVECGLEAAFYVLLAFDGGFDASAGEPFAGEVGGFEGGVYDGASTGAEVDFADLFCSLEDAGVDLEVGEDVLSAVELDVAVEFIEAFVCWRVAPDVVSPVEEACDEVGEFVVAGFFYDGAVAACVEVDGGEFAVARGDVVFSVGEGVFFAGCDEVPEFEFSGESFFGAFVGLEDVLGEVFGAEARDGLMGCVLEAAAEGVDVAVDVFCDAVGADGYVAEVEFVVMPAVAEEAAVEVHFVFLGIEFGAGEFVECDVGCVGVPDFVFF